MNKSHKVASWAILTAGLLIISTFIYNGLTAVKAQGTTIIVNTTSDVVDFGGARQVANLPGPDGKTAFREAVLAANNTVGPQTIAFNIPTSDPGFNGTTFIITLDLGSILSITDNYTTIDGATQTAFTGDTNPGGPEIDIWGSNPVTNNIAALTVNSSNNSIKAIAGFLFFFNGLKINGSNNVVTGCFIRQSLSTSIIISGSNNTIGGTTPGAENLISGGGYAISMTGASATGNVVQGNNLTGNHSGGVSMDSATSGNTVVGNVINSNGHGDSQGNPVGTDVSVGGSNNVVQDNYIGVDATGTQAQGGLVYTGVQVTGAFHTISDNVISGHNSRGFSLSSRQAAMRVGGGSGTTTHDIAIEGNFIGTDASGTAALPNQIGIVVAGDSDIMIGGTGFGEANVVAFNTANGVHVSGTNATGVTISGNSIHDNGELGIDLGTTQYAYPASVTANDPGDGDTGANGLQNFPVITSITDHGTSTSVTGSIDTPNPQTITIELFSSDTADASGFGEGEVFQGTATPDAGGTFVATLPGGLNSKWITATATNAAGSTSEFSEAVIISCPGNRPPVANAGPNQTAYPATTVTLNGAASFDPDGGPMTYQWVQTTNYYAPLTGANTPNPTFQTFDAPLTDIVLTFQLTVTDDCGLSSTDTVSVTVLKLFTIIAPNGGENWPVGSTQTIQWAAGIYFVGPRIEVSRNGGSTWEVVVASTNNDGSFEWVVTGPASTQCLVRTLPGPNDPNPLGDTSDAVFTISGGSPASLTVTAPNGGETWPTNTMQTITWTSSNLSGNVNIELSRDGGATYTTLFANTPNDGSQSWTVMGPATTQALIKISSVTTPSVSDTSNGPFTISSPPPGASLTVVVPDGGEVWRINTTQRIQWTSSGVSGNVKIELSRDGGATYTTLFANTPNDGSQNWRVTGPATTQASIKISSVTTPSVSDTSNGVFGIRR